MNPEALKHYESIKIDTRKKANIPTQIAHQIKLLIRDKILKEADPLPTPSTLADLLKVHEDDIRAAYYDLIRQVYIKEEGGTYKVVRLQMMEGFLKGFYSVFETFQRHGFTPSSEEISARLVPELPSQFQELSSMLKGPFIFQRRLYKVNNHPLFLVDFYNLPKYFEGMDYPLKDIDFLTYFKKELNHPMVHFKREVIALKPSKEEAALLDVPGQSAILGAKLINYDVDHIPLNFSIWRGSLKFSFFLNTPVL
jgi:DNA-binding GntR family transcriptional regulator